MMKKVRLIRAVRLTLLIPFITVLIAFSFVGCSQENGTERAYYYERPAVGFTVTDETVMNIDVPEQNSLNISAKDGVVRITRYDGDSIQVTEKRSLKGPATRKRLKEMLAGSKLTVKKVGTEVKMTSGTEEKQKALYRLTDEMDVKIPDKMKNITIEAGSGGLEVAGLKGMSSVKLVLAKGSIKVEESEGYLLHTELTNGNLDVNGFTGSGIYQCDRGIVTLKAVKGSIKLKSLDGKAVIEESEGSMDCDISAGSLAIRSCLVRKDTALYTSAGEIVADFSDLDSNGKYAVKASNGHMRIKLPKKSGWSLLAESVSGSVSLENLDSGDAKELKKAPSGEIYGDIRGGGPDIFLYTDMGSIDLSE